MDKILILNKLKDYKNFKSEVDFSRFLGITPQNLSKWRERNTYKIDVLSMKYPEVNTEWLLTGEGEMLKSNIQSEPSTNADLSIERLLSIIESQQRTIEILTQKL